MFVACLILIVFAAGCGRDSSPDAARQPGQPKAKSGKSSDYFKTHFQDESQFIVENIAADLAELAFYAKNQQLPAANDFSVAATETSAPDNGPVYKVRIALGRKTRSLKWTWQSMGRFGLQRCTRISLNAWPKQLIWRQLPVRRAK